MRTRRFRSMRTWVCRARFAADRVFAIDRMKRAARLLGLRISSTGNSEGESLEGENLVRQTSTRVNKTGPLRWICLFEASSREVVFGRGSSVAANCPHEVSDFGASSKLIRSCAVGATKNRSRYRRNRFQSPAIPPTAVLRRPRRPWKGDSAKH